MSNWKVNFYLFFIIDVLNAQYNEEKTKNIASQLWMFVIKNVGIGKNNQDERFYNSLYSFIYLYDFMWMFIFYVALMNLLYMY